MSAGVLLSQILPSSISRQTAWKPVTSSRLAAPPPTLETQNAALIFLAVYSPIHSGISNESDSEPLL